MVGKGNRSAYFSELRRKALEIISAEAARVPAETGTTDALSAEDTRLLVHELLVHQTELEMQNEELSLAQTEVEAARARYVDLFDQAPVGYLTLSEDGRVLLSNLTAASMLGLTPKSVV